MFAGNIIALASITVNTGAPNSGSLIALTAAVTLDTNTIYSGFPSHPSTVPVVVSPTGPVACICNPTFVIPQCNPEVICNPNVICNKAGWDGEMYDHEGHKNDGWKDKET